MGATSVTGLSGGGDTGQRVVDSLNQYDEHFVGLGNSNPRVVAAGVLVLDDSGEGIIPVSCWGDVSAACDSSGCAWNVNLRMAVVKSYVHGSPDYAPLTHGFNADDPVFSHADYLAGSARLPLVDVIFSGEPGEPIDYIISTIGRVA